MPLDDHPTSTHPAPHQRDRGTFEVTDLARGGFLMPDGSPLPTQEKFTERYARPHRTLPVKDEPSAEGTTTAMQLAIAFIVVVLIVTALVLLLINSDRSPSLGEANNLRGLLPSAGESPR